MKRRNIKKNIICIAMTTSLAFTGFSLNTLAADENNQNIENTQLNDNTNETTNGEVSGGSNNTTNGQDASGTNNTQNGQDTSGTNNTQNGQDTSNTNSGSNTQDNQAQNNQSTNETTQIISATSIILKNAKEVLSVGETLDLKKNLTVNPKEAEIKWESSRPSLVKVEDGVITALGAGSAVIKAISKGNEAVNATCEITVKESKYFTQIIFTDNELKIQPGEVETVEGVLYPNTVMDDVVKWESTNPDIASVVADDKDYKKIYITGENVGTCYVVAKVGDGAEIGKLKIKVGNPSGLEKTRIIKESVPTITSLRRGKGSFKVKYKEIEYASGYQIKYKKSGKYIAVTTKKKSLKVKNLPKGVYKVKIRAYRNYEGKKYYGKYSRTLKIKVK